MTTVRDWVESFCHHGSSEFASQIARYAEKNIVKEFDGRAFAFPQMRFTHRNVMNWVLLEDGTSVGFNESPRSGWSFPRSSKRITKLYLDTFRDRGLIDDSV